MIVKIWLPYTLPLLLILLPVVGQAKESSGHQEAQGIESLSTDVRQLLSEEMKALQSGMMSIIPAAVSGNWSEVEVTARKMKESYIFKKKLTEAQAKELHAVLPPAFVKMDQRFHYLAGMLEHVASERKSELVNFYFSEMNASCVNCHSEFATHRFPALIPEKDAGQSH